ncbi:MAG: ABC transporter permease [Tissierellaceae bacterium]
MKISNMAINNVKGNLYKYVMYYLSNSFAVMAFFIFSNFVFHPAFDYKNLGGHVVAQAGAINGMIICQVIIVVFSILFVGYSTSIFLRSRGKEFGLLSLYGMTRGQIKKYVMIESTIISFLSTITGILCGVVFSKLFLMAMEAFMNISLPFNISIKALILTAAVFFFLFEVVSILMLFNIKNKEIVQQLKSAKIPKEVPKFSKKKSILGISLLIIGYIVAWLVEGALVVLAMIPVTVIVIIGTYFLFTQFSIFIVNKLNKNKKFIYNKTNLVAFSQMIFKLQDTANVLFLAAILGAITFTATETVYSFFTEVPKISGFNTPENMIIVQKGETLQDTESIDRAEEIFKKHNIKVDEHHVVKSIEVINNSNEESSDTVDKILVISNSDYNKLAVSQDREAISVREGEAVYNFPYAVYDFNGKQEDIKRFPFKVTKLSLNGENKEYRVSKEIHGGVMSLNKVGYFDVFVLNDNDYNQILDIAKEDDIVIYNGFNLDKWKKSYNASMEIKESLGDRYQLSFYSQVLPFKETRKSFGMILFIGFFISFLFFIAAGSIIYFKLFNEIKQDKVEYSILRKIGTTEREINKIITKQIGIIFFLPFIVSTTHSLFALKSLSNLMETNLLANGIVVMLGYMVFQVIYFMIIRSVYIRKINYR